MRPLGAGTSRRSQPSALQDQPDVPRTRQPTRFTVMLKMLPSSTARVAPLALARQGQTLLCLPKVRAGGAASPPRPPLTEENRAATSSVGPVSPQSDSGSPEPPRKSLRVESPPLGRGGAFPSGAPLGFEPRRSLRSGRLTRSASLPAVSSPSGVSLGAQASSPSKLDGAAPRDESSGTPPRRGPVGGL